MTTTNKLIKLVVNERITAIAKYKSEDANQQPAPTTIDINASATCIILIPLQNKMTQKR